MAQSQKKKLKKVGTKKQKQKITYEKALGSSHWGNVVSVGMFFGICDLKKGWRRGSQGQGIQQGREKGQWHMDFKRKDSFYVSLPMPPTSVHFSEQS